MLHGFIRVQFLVPARSSCYYQPESSIETLDQLQSGNTFWLLINY